MIQGFLARVALSLLLLALATGGCATQYQIIELGSLGGTSAEPHGINDNGQVVGSSSLPGNSGTHAYSWRNGVMQDLGVNPGGLSSVARAVNDNGLVVGITGSASSYLACTWQGGTQTLLPSLADPYTFGEAFDVNNAGQIVGTCWSRAQRKACLWADGTVTALPGIGGNYEIAWGINSGGQIAGYATNSAGHYHACTWQNGIVTDLGPGYAYDVNDEGRVVGSSIDSGGGYWQETAFTAIGGLDAQYRFSGPVAINNNGLIVGYARYYTGDANYTKACVWENSICTALPIAPGWAGGNSKAMGVNDNGQIVGYVYDSKNVKHAVLWNPIPEPSTVVALLCGIGGLPALLRRRRA